MTKIDSGRDRGQVLCDNLKKAADAWMLNQALQGRDANSDLGKLKRAEPGIISYLESLREGSLIRPICFNLTRDGLGRQGRIEISREDGAITLPMLQILDFRP